MADKDFFLEPDDAQTLGDVKYMRKSVRIRRTFPKTLKNPQGFALEKEFSATEGGKVSANDTSSSSNFVGQSTFTPAPAPAPAPTPAPTPAPAPTTKTSGFAGKNVQDRQKGDPGINKFRDMAKNIGGKGRR
ncbi:MAG: hypothetical protein AB4372_38860 [Xenococcus sp. (in: cyanobacteria)]